MAAAQEPGDTIRVAGIETGGTKIVCAVGHGSTIEALARFPTTTSPAADLDQVLAFLASHGPISAIGVGTFGPCDPNPASDTFGFVTTTPKPGWANTDVLSHLRRGVGDIPMAFDTDVNAAAVGEARWGAGQGLGCLVYVTIGTGIGAGALIDGRPVHGLLHPEMGHMRIPHDGHAGICPTHGDCWEGLCAGPALAARWGRPAQDLPDGHEAWPIAAAITGRALHNIVLTMCPQRIILGGGVGANPSLATRVGAEMSASLNGYINVPQLRTLDTYIVPPGLGSHSGVLGAMAMAEDALAGIGG